MGENEHALNTKQAARILGLSPGSLAVMRSRGSGPPHTYSGAKPVYYASQLKEWQADCAAKHRKTSAQQAEV